MKINNIWVKSGFLCNEFNIQIKCHVECNLLFCCSALNGVVDPLETYSDVTAPPGGSAAEPPPSSESAPSTVPTPTSTHGIPLDQLKQMLSSQLEYYFSR